MESVLQPWCLLGAVLAGWISCEQQAVIEHQRTESRFLGCHDPHRQQPGGP